MKVLITEKQYKRLLENQEPEVLHIPSFKYFNNDWNMLQEYLESEGNPPYVIDSNLDLRGTDITSLGNLQSVGGWLDLLRSNIKSLGNLQSVGSWLDLYESEITSLGNLISVGDLNLSKTNITSLGNLQSVGGTLNLYGTKITSLGNLISVGGDLFLQRTPLSKKYSEDKIRNMVNVEGSIYM